MGGAASAQQAVLQSGKGSARSDELDGGPNQPSIQVRCSARYQFPGVTVWVFICFAQFLVKVMRCGFALLNDYYSFTIVHFPARTSYSRNCVVWIVLHANKSRVAGFTSVPVPAACTAISLSSDFMLGTWSTCFSVQSFPIFLKSNWNRAHHVEFRIETGMAHMFSI